MRPFTTAEEMVNYFLIVLKNTEDMPKPNFQQVAKDAGVNNANNAQKRFKSMVEKAGFSLVNGHEVTVADGADIPSLLPPPPARRANKARKRFKSMVEKSGSSLVNGHQVSEADEAEIPSPLEPPRMKRTKDSEDTPASPDNDETPASKKSKLTVKEEELSDDDRPLAEIRKHVRASMIGGKCA